MLWCWVQGRYQLFARSSRFLPVVKDYGGLGMWRGAQSNAAALPLAPGLQHQTAVSLFFWDGGQVPRAMEMEVNTLALRVLAPASCGPVCLDVALLWDTRCLPLIWFVGGWETPQPWWGLVCWGDRLHPVCFHSFLWRLGWAMEKATRFPTDPLHSEIPCSCQFWGRIYLVFCEGHLACCNSILSSLYLIQISKVNLLITCMFLLKVFLIMKKAPFWF